MSLGGSDDKRPFVEIEILGTVLNCLLDTGASVSIAGSNGTKLLQSLGLNTDQNYMSSISTADETKHLITGVFYVPITFKDKVSMVRIFSVPTVSINIILGIDFFKNFDITLYHDNHGWSCNLITSIEPSTPKSNKVIPYHELSKYEQTELDTIISKFKSLSTGRLGRTPFITHHIETGNALPIKQRSYPVSPAVQERMGKQLERMISLGVIERSFSPWSSPVVLVKKKDGSDRLCVDSRKLNSVTVRDSYPLPRVSEILDRLGKTNFLSKIDLKDAFWQIPLSPDSKSKTAFSVPGHGLYQFTRLPFGLHNAAQCLQRLMNAVFGSTDCKIFVYLDDLIVASETFNEHMNVLNLVFDRLCAANLTINYEKSEFCCSSLSYLGYVVDAHGLHTDQSKVDTIVNFPLPRTYTELKRFIGLTSWYSRFIEHFATTAAPLHNLTKGKSKNKSIQWTDEARDSFMELKNKLISSPVLVLPDFTKRFYIHTDASNYGIGAVITQDIEEHPIAYASRKFRGPELKYSAPEKECLAVFFALHKFRPYIEGYEFTVVTDCSALTFLFKQENPPGRLARWIMYLSQYRFSIVHRKGSANVVPDTLSRTVEHLAIIDIVPKATDDWYIRMLSKVALSPVRYKDWKIENGKLYYDFKPKTAHLNNDSPWCVVVPKSARDQVIEECHDAPSASHMGIKKTKARILERYYWPGVGKDVDKYVKACITCKQCKHSNAKSQGLMGKFKNATRPFQMISLDFIGPLPRSTKMNTCLLVVTDWITKFPLLFPLRQATASKVVNILENNVFLIFGVPEIIVADNGKQFSGKEFHALTRRYGIEKLWFNTRYHPQNNPTERVNKTIGHALRAYVGDNHRHWDVHIGQIGLALRTAINEITGYSPFYLNFGRNYTYSGSDYSTYFNKICDENTATAKRVEFLDKFKEIFKDICLRIKQAYNKNKRYYDRNKKDVKLSVGDMVFKKNYVQSDAAQYFSAKLAPVFIPCRVLNKISDLVYELVDLNGVNLGKWHIKDIKLS